MKAVRFFLTHPVSSPTILNFQIADDNYVSNYDFIMIPNSELSCPFIIIMYKFLFYLILRIRSVATPGVARRADDLNARKGTGTICQ